jgi:hypothetical protein
MSSSAKASCRSPNFKTSRSARSGYVGLADAGMEEGNKDAELMLLELLGGERS